MKRETGAIAQCHISGTERVKKPSTSNRDMLCVYSGCADVDVEAGSGTAALLSQPVGTGNIINCCGYRVLILSCA